MREGPWVDLHTHTTASDGDLSPAELVQAAKAAGLGAVAVTDHDTLDGLAEALEEGERIGIEVISGVEISVEMDRGKGTFHLLGYGIDPHHEGLRSVLGRLQQARSERNLRILERLETLGMPLNPSLLERLAGGGQVGRPHFARALVAEGYVQTVEEAFDRFLGKGRPAYVDKFRLGPSEAIEVVKSAGGIPVLAHPFTLGFEIPLQLEAFVARLVEEFGLMGLEVLYPDHDDGMVSRYMDLAERYDLLKTGGTDFHGSTKPAVALGTGRGGLRVPYAWVEALRERLSRANRLDKGNARG
jgi:hypothetical protein